MSERERDRERQRERETESERERKRLRRACERRKPPKENPEPRTATVLALLRPVMLSYEDTACGKDIQNHPKPAGIDQAVA